GGVRLGAQSKAQRGYRLAGLGKPLTLQSLPVANGSDAVMRITSGLQHWQHHEQYWLEQADPEQRQLALLAIRQGVALIVDATATQEPVWLAALTDLSTHLALLAQEPADKGCQAALSTQFHRVDYVRLQLAIAAWLLAVA
ncbi:MAG: hypothetical protein RLZZ616_622, partial [Pseudomonadota bacterium]